MRKEPVCFRGLTANLDPAALLPFPMPLGIRLGEFRTGNRQYIDLPALPFAKSDPANRTEGSPWCGVADVDSARRVFVSLSCLSEV